MTVAGKKLPETYGKTPIDRSLEKAHDIAKPKQRQRLNVSENHSLGIFLFSLTGVLQYNLTKRLVFNRNDFDADSLAQSTT